MLAKFVYFVSHVPPSIAAISTFARFILVIFSVLKKRKKLLDFDYLIL